MVRCTDAAIFRHIAIYFGVLEPIGDLEFEYLAEGAANAIFSVRFKNSNLDKHDKACCVRFRKDLVFVSPTRKTIQDFEEKIAPIFMFDPSLLLPPTRLDLSEELVLAVNEELRNLEGNGVRPKNRHGVYLPSFATEPSAILMPNLHQTAGQMVEFKPKWLVQSPSAPRSSQNCRTCALNGMRRRKGHAKGRGDSGFCPFDLLSSDETILTNALQSVWADTSTLSAFATSFKVKVQPVLRHLQKLQRHFNELGIHHYENPKGKDFSIALALRDCSIFLKAVVSLDREAVDVNLVKILDLDLKDAGGGKLAKWAGMERELIDDEWYTDTSKSEIPCAMLFQ